MTVEELSLVERLLDADMKIAAVEAQLEAATRPWPALPAWSDLQLQVDLLRRQLNQRDAQVVKIQQEATRVGKDLMQAEVRAKGAEAKLQKLQEKKASAT